MAEKPDSFDYQMSLNGVEKDSYVKKLKLLRVEEDPFSLSPENWTDDLTLWPPTEFGHIYTYLIDTPGQFTREKLKAYKSLEAFNYYMR